jgi:outer membrane protein assembly factor BamB
MKRSAWMVGLALAAAAGCGPSGTFAMSGEDNSPVALQRAFAMEKKPQAGKPVNGTGAPMAFLVVAGKPKKLMAWDLASGKGTWTVEADVTSRVAVGTQLIAHLEGKSSIVARSQLDGKKLWTHELESGETFLGLTADGGRVFYTVQDDDGKRTWYLVAVEDGKELWRADAPGTLGAPAARGGLVYMPFLTQWLTIVDAKTGQVVARIRQEDEAINFVRATTDGVYYGSKGVFRLDEKSTAGKKAQTSYLSAKLPEFVRVFYHFDAFKAVQSGYSAYDRNRVLWRVDPEKPELAFKDNLAIVFTYRFFFGFDVATGALKWAHHHPKFDVVSAEHVGTAIVYVSQAGELGALDPASGAVLWQSKIGGTVLGATFDADGYRPAGSPKPPSTKEALASIVWDKDARFNPQKMFAVEALASLPGADVTELLVKILQDEGTAQPVYQRAGEALATRKDAEGLASLLKALDVRHDFLAGTKPRAVEMIARALGAIGKAEAAPALIAHLEDPETPLPVVKEIVEALAAVKSPEALPPLRSHLLLYRVDPAFASDVGPMSATIDALLALGGGAERELIAYVASEPRTQPKLAEYARRALSQTKPTQ